MWFLNVVYLCGFVKKPRRVTPMNNMYHSAIFRRYSGHKNVKFLIRRMLQTISIFKPVSWPSKEYNEYKLIFRTFLQVSNCLYF